MRYGLFICQILFFTFIFGLTVSAAVHFPLLVSEEEYASWATGDLITRLYNGSARDLVAALVHSDGLTKEDIEELRGMFRVED